ncbi:MAG: polyhydroxyalkanoic acid system family protein [bacterium]
MADISVHRTHDLPLEDARGKIDQIVTDIQSEFGNLVSSVTWNADKTVADVSGKAFTGKFHLAEGKVGIDVDLKLFAKPLKSKVKEKIEERMTRYFG